MKQSLFIVSILSLLFLGGCLKNTEIIEGDQMNPPSEQVEISEQAQAEADKRITGNETCDAYLATIKCIAQKGEEDNEFTKNYTSIVDSFANVPADQLQETCTMLSTAIQEHPTLLLYNAECNMINPDQALLDAINDSATGGTSIISSEEQASLD